MTSTGLKRKQEVAEPAVLPDDAVATDELEDSRRRQVALLRLFWERRRFILRASAIGLSAATLIAFVIPKRYEATAQLMPPDSQSASGMAMMAALTARTGSGLGAMAGDLLGMKSTGAIFVGILKSQSVQEDLVKQFNLRNVYGDRYLTDARRDLDRNSSIFEDRKSGIIGITVSDQRPQRAAALANAYVDKLNTLVVDLSTSSAHRERVFLEGRLKTVKRDLDDASNQFAQFSSKNGTLDLQQQGKAMLDAAGTLAGEKIAAESELEGLRQVYTDNNIRVRSLSARVAELNRELDAMGGTSGNPGPGANSPAAPAGRRSGDMPFPSIRKLPLIGAEFGDYYRRAKIQETVYELLTEQYEMAKVQEAKETPSVKILDPAEVPEKKSFPPRLEIVALGGFLACALSVAWVSGVARWQAMDPKDERKVFLQDVIATVRVGVPWAPGNGDAPHLKGSRNWTQRFRERPPDNSSE